jgi:hypothetical protein
MKTDKKISLLKLNLMKLKNGGHVPPGSLKGIVPKEQLLGLYNCWYEELPEDELIKPDSIIEIERLNDIADHLHARMLLAYRDAETAFMYETQTIKAYEDVDQFLLKARQIEPNLSEWLDRDVFSSDKSSVIDIPVTIGTRDSKYFVGKGNALCPSSASLKQKMKALEQVIEDICEGYESKTLEPFMTDIVDVGGSSHEYR